MKHASTSAPPTPTATMLRPTLNCNSQWARSKVILSRSTWLGEVGIESYLAAKIHGARRWAAHRISRPGRFEAGTVPKATSSVLVAVTESIGGHPAQHFRSQTKTRPLTTSAKKVAKKPRRPRPPQTARARRPRALFGLTWLGSSIPNLLPSRTSWQITWTTTPPARWSPVST